MVERRLAKAEVAGSSPVSRSMKNPTFVCLTNVGFLNQVCITAREANCPKWTEERHIQKTKKNIMILIASIICIFGITSLAGLINYIASPVLQNAARVGLNVLNALTAFAAMKLTGMKIEIDLKNKRQYPIGIGIALILSAVIAFIPTLCGFSLVGTHIDFSMGVIIINFLLYMLIIGPVEEFVFRVFFQDAFVGFFEKRKWMGVVLSSLLFGFWHIINGNIIQVLFTFGIGLVFGFARFKIKGCDYAGLAVGHGLYDFLNTIVRMLVV